jgi:RNA polymerase sporulation-specific sigma factor
MEKFDLLTDEELVSRSRNGDGAAADFLMNKYKGLVKQKARSMFILGGDTDDLMQEGMLGLFKALRDYDSRQDASFYTFAGLCISRQLYTAVQASGRKKHLPLNTAVSLNSMAAASGAGSSDESSQLLMDIITADEAANPEERLAQEESLRYLEEGIERVLSPFERQVLELHLTGLGYVEIAHILGKSEKQTDNAMQRMRSKIRRLIKDKENAGLKG